MNSAPLVSVIVAVYNGEAYLSEALQSVFAQAYASLEVIVVDDGSTDGSARLCASFEDVHYICQENLGVAAARNRAVEVARGAYLAFLDQDDRWHATKLNTQIDYLIAHPEVDYVLAQQDVFLDGSTEKPSWLKGALLDEEHVGYHLGTALIRRAAFDHVGIFDPRYRIGSDSDWFLRAKDAGLRLQILPEMLLHKRVHDKNESSRVEQNSVSLEESMGNLRLRELPQVMV